MKFAMRVHRSARFDLNGAVSPLLLPGADFPCLDCEIHAMPKAAIFTVKTRWSPAALLVRQHWSCSRCCTGSKSWNTAFAN